MKERDHPEERDKDLSFGEKIEERYEVLANELSARRDHIRHLRIERLRKTQERFAETHQIYKEILDMLEDSEEKHDEKNNGNGADAVRSEL